MLKSTEQAIEFGKTLGLSLESIRGGRMTAPVKVENGETRRLLEDNGFDVNPVTWYCSFKSKEK